MQDIVVHTPKLAILSPVVLQLFYAVRRGEFSNG
jgi:hypothetical protein